MDPREFSLVPFGGAGPLHGVALAEAVSARDVLVPVAPGITAAMGLLETDMQYEHVRSFITSLTHIEPAAVDRLDALVEELVGGCRRDLENDGAPPERQSFGGSRNAATTGRGSSCGRRSRKAGWGPAKSPASSRASTPSTASTTVTPSTTRRWS